MIRPNWALKSQLAHTPFSINKTHIHVFSYCRVGGKVAGSLKLDPGVCAKKIHGNNKYFFMKETFWGGPKGTAHTTVVCASTFVIQESVPLICFLLQVQSCSMRQHFRAALLLFTEICIFELWSNKKIRCRKAWFRPSMEWTYCVLKLGGVE